MTYIYLGKVVNTHGIKGEIRILSNFEKKDLVFKKGMHLYFGKSYVEEEIVTYRHHKEYEMVTLKNYQNINEVLKYLKEPVYCQKEELSLKDNEYLLEELIGLNVIENGESIGKVKEIVYNNSNVLLYITSTKNFYIPHNEEYIKKVDLQAKEIIVEHTKGLIL